MSKEETEARRLRSALLEAINKVPRRLSDSGVLETRKWMEARANARRVAMKPTATAAELANALRSIE